MKMNLTQKHPCESGLGRKGAKILLEVKSREEIFHDLENCTLVDMELKHSSRGGHLDKSRCHYDSAHAIIFQISLAIKIFLEIESL